VQRSRCKTRMTNPSHGLQPPKRGARQGGRAKFCAPTTRKSNAMTTQSWATFVELRKFLNGITTPVVSHTHGRKNVRRR